MPKIILNNQVVEDSWQLVTQEESVEVDANKLGDGNYLVPLSLWNSLVAELTTPPENIGLWLSSTELPEQIQGGISDIPVLAVDFPAFADGRGFSIARLLRERYGYTGQLRAIGKPIRDQLSYLVRCGFNAFDLADHYDPEQALASLKDFSDNYQGAVDQPVPLFRRRS